MARRPVVFLKILMTLGAAMVSMLLCREMKRRCDAECRVQCLFFTLFGKREMDSTECKMAKADSGGCSAVVCCIMCIMHHCVSKATSSLIVLPKSLRM
jgi:hypothetical protein